jgi:hypothetical protein
VEGGRDHVEFTSWIRLLLRDPQHEAKNVVTLQYRIHVNFRPGEKEDIMIVIHKYLVIAIQYDYPFTMVKYCVQQLLGSLQDTAMGNSSFRNFLMLFFLKELITLFLTLIKGRYRASYQYIPIVLSCWCRNSCT